ncbi:MAG: hypothetical protein Q9162_005526 [Coniocarpon cinnabarinum]
MYKNLYNCVVAWLALCVPCIDTNAHRQKKIAERRRIKITKKGLDAQKAHVKVDDIMTKPQAVAPPEPFLADCLASGAYKEVGQYERDKVQKWRAAHPPPKAQPNKLQHIPREEPKCEITADLVGALARRNMGIVAKGPQSPPPTSASEVRSSDASASAAPSSDSPKTELQTLSKNNTACSADDARGANWPLNGDNDEKRRWSSTKEEHHSQSVTEKPATHNDTDQTDVPQENPASDQRSSQPQQSHLSRGNSDNSEASSSAVPDLIHTNPEGSNEGKESPDSSDDYPFDQQDIEDVDLELVETAQGILLPAIPSFSSSNRSSMHEAILNVGRTPYIYATGMPMPNTLKRYSMTRDTSRSSTLKRASYADSSETVNS